MAVYSRFMRGSLLEVVNTDYVRTARAKGLTEQRVTMRHAVRNALIPVGHPGRAQLRRSDRRCDRHGVDLPARRDGELLHPEPVQPGHLPDHGLAHDRRDLVILFNLIADILYGFLDPRVRYD